MPYPPVRLFRSVNTSAKQYLYFRKYNEALPCSCVRAGVYGTAWMSSNTDNNCSPNTTVWHITISCQLNVPPAKCYMGTTRLQWSWSCWNIKQRPRCGFRCSWLLRWVAGLMILDVSTERNAFIFKGQGVILLGLLERYGVVYWFKRQRNNIPTQTQIQDSSISL